VGVAKIFVKVAHVQEAGNKGGVIVRVIVGFFHKRKAFVAHFEHSVAFLRSQGKV
jgi:hypothetical protein